MEGTWSWCGGPGDDMVLEDSLGEQDDAGGCGGLEDTGRERDGEGTVRRAGGDGGFLRLRLWGRKDHRVI